MERLSVCATTADVEAHTNDINAEGLGALQNGEGVARCSSKLVAKLR